MKPLAGRTLALPLIAILVLAGCSNTREGAKKDAEIAAQQTQEQARELEASARRGAEKAAEATSQAVDDVKDGAAKAADATAEATSTAVTEVKEGAEKAAEATSEALDEAGQRAAAAGRTLEVKTALMADKRVDASRIDVDSEFAAKVVHLRGAVSTEAEKAAAEAIAKEKASGWRVSNELEVKAK